MKLAFKTVVAAATLVLGSQAMAQITLYQGEGFRGRAVTTNGAVPDLSRLRFDDRAGSAVVDRGRWEVCERPHFEGRCALLRRGNYDTLRDTGLEWRISSVRPAGNRRYEAEPQASTAPLYEYRQRPNERTFEVPVNWTRAVMGAPNQRCWIERQAVPVQQQQPNYGGMAIGAVVGGILGHQIGGGSGKDAATGIGVVTGAMVGNNIATRSGTYAATQDVQRCESSTSGTPAYYEVSYTFRGTEHRAQMSTPPGTTIVVNGRGEPRM